MDMKKSPSKQNKSKQKSQTETIVSRILGKQIYIELLYAPRLERTVLGLWKDGKFEVVSTYTHGKDKTLIPVKPSNNLIKHGVVLLPSYAEDYGNTAKLIKNIQSFIHKYCDLGEQFETVATYYVLMSWVYDRFRELPYLRMQGDFGTGKTRFLQVIGSLCYKPLFASGASTISPIFHTLDMFRGTLVMDEADFRFSDEKADIIKILNNGNMNGFPLLRSEVSKSGTYNPRAFQVFGPKILATRGAYSDPALESRIITKRAKTGNIRRDIPLTLPEGFETDAETLRNKLLMFRFKNWHNIIIDAHTTNNQTSNRISQIFKPLLVLAQDAQAKAVIHDYAKESDNILSTARAFSPEEHVLQVIYDLMNKNITPLSIKAITSKYQLKYGGEHTTPVTPKWIGSVLRNKLHLGTVKRQGVYIIAETEQPRLNALFNRYGISTNKQIARPEHK